MNKKNQNNIPGDQPDLIDQSLRHHVEKIKPTSSFIDRLAVRLRREHQAHGPVTVKPKMAYARVGLRGCFSSSGGCCFHSEGVVAGRGRTCRADRYRRCFGDARKPANAGANC